MKRNVALFSSLILSLSVQLTAYATDMDMSNMEMDSSSTASASAIEAVGIVDDIDEAKGIVTLSHEAIKSLGWPAMTMKFTVSDTKLFKKLSKGKKIHFAFIQQKGKYLVTYVK
jgi:Cu(I)/Ag(I) efflux system protein CusF